jgi:predicted HTH transcriptional regulator
MKEAQHIEWKETWRDELLRWICGFANAEGGVLHIGRNDQGVVVGVPNAARLLEELPNKVWAIRYQPGDLWVEFAFPAQYLAVIPASLSEGEWGEKWGEKWGASLTAKRRKIVEAMRRNTRVTIPELAAELGLGTSAIENHLKAIRVAGCVRRIGPAKGGRWEVLS